jgi:predicted ATPase
MNELFVRGIKLHNEVVGEKYPFSIPAVKNIESVSFTNPVTFLVGENGSGKSTLVEAIAVAAGFNAEGGTFGYAGPIPLLFEGKHIHEQSHGEAFLSIVKGFRPGLFIFDEPESALSPQRIMHLMAAMHELAKQGSQFIVATHSPVLLAYPGATIYELTVAGVNHVNYDDIEHVKITRDFLNNPSLFISKLFAD